MHALGQGAVLHDLTHIQQVGYAINLSENRADHRQRADADSVIAFLQACNGALRLADPLRKILHGSDASNAPFVGSCRRSQVLVEHSLNSL